MVAHPFSMGSTCLKGQCAFRQNKRYSRRGGDGFVHRWAEKSREALSRFWVTVIGAGKRKSNCKDEEDSEMDDVVSRHQSDIMLPTQPEFPSPVRNLFSVDLPKDRPWWGRMDLLTSEWDEQNSSKDINGDVEDIVLKSSIGRGAHATVHKADLHGWTVAVKVVSQSERQGAHGEMYVAPELELLQGISHPNLVEIYAVHEVDETCAGSLDSWGILVESSCESDIFASPGQIGGDNRWQESSSLGTQTWIVMEYCDRGSLWDAIQKGEFRMGPTCNKSYEKIIAVGLEIAFGMRHLHKMGIIHGDLKAQNIILQSSRSYEKGFVAKVGDFGLCRRPKHGRMDMTTFSWGTVDHMAPETLQLGKLHAATDVFSYGVLMLEMITGTQPFHGMTTPAVIMSIVNGMRPTIPDSCPPDLALLIEDCWQQDWGLRPSFATIVGRLANIVL